MRKELGCTAVRLLRPADTPGMDKTYPAGLILCLDATPGVRVAPVRYENGVPVYRFRKELIRTGRFLTSDEQPFEVTPTVLSNWSQQFASMKAAGVPVPVPADHTLVDGDHNRGFVTDVFVEDGSLIGVLDLVGDKAPELAAVNNVSIYSVPEWTDGAGNKYAWPIRHVALTPDPRIPGLTGFVPLAASNSGVPNQVPVLKLSSMMHEGNPLAGAGEPAAGPAAVEKDPIDAVIDQIEAQYLPKIREATDKAERRKIAAEMAKKIDDAIKLFAEEEPEPKPDEGEEGEGGEEGDGPTALSNKDAPSPMLIKLAAKSRRQDIEGLFAAGKITKPQRDTLLAKWVEGNRVGLTLSNAAVEDFDAVIDLLGKGQAIKTGPHGGVQLANPYTGPGAEEAEKAAKEEEARWRVKK